MNRKVVIEWHDVQKEGNPTSDGSYLVTTACKNHESIRILTYSVNGEIGRRYKREAGWNDGSGKVIAWAFMPIPYITDECIEMRVSEANAEIERLNAEIKRYKEALYE